MQHISAIIDNVAAMRTAVRVLTAITNRVEPSLPDVMELRRLAPEYPNLPADELACQVVQRVHEKRTRAKVEQSIAPIAPAVDTPNYFGQ